MTGLLHQRRVLFYEKPLSGSYQYVLSLCHSLPDEACISQEHTERLPGDAPAMIRCRLRPLFMIGYPSWLPCCILIATRMNMYWYLHLTPGRSRLIIKPV